MQNGHRVGSSYWCVNRCERSGCGVSRSRRWIQAAQNLCDQLLTLGNCDVSRPVGRDIQVRQLSPLIVTERKRFVPRSSTQPLEVVISMPREAPQQRCMGACKKTCSIKIHRARACHVAHVTTFLHVELGHSSPILCADQTLIQE